MLLTVLFACSAPTTTPLSIGEAPGTSAHRVALKGAELRVELMTSWSPDCPESTTCRSVFVAPLVGPRWTPDDPVPAWLSCRPVLQKPIECMVALKQAQSFEGPVRTRVGDSPSTSWHEAIQRAEETYSLESAAQAPVVELDFMPTING